MKEGLVRENEVHEVVQRMTKGSQAVMKLADELSMMAVTYVAICNADHEKWNAQFETRKAVEVLNLVDVKLMRPLILAIAEKIPENEISQTMSFCVSAAVRLIIAGKMRTGKVEKGFADAAKKIYSKEIELGDELRDELSRFTPSNTEFLQAFATARVSNRKLARYYLRSLESAVNSDVQPWHVPNDNSNEINLEHVLPERTEGNWPQFSEEERVQYWKRIGNLCLLKSRDNSTLRSSPYRDKKSVYKSSEYISTSQVAEVDEWTAAAIEKRQTELSKLAVKTWRF
ncbi:MAG: HNH endonuclease [Synechococcus sp. SB0678_bin_12]|nr:HNH endonuclease [Synechococcus sp. SB0678_bin_12]